MTAVDPKYIDPVTGRIRSYREMNEPHVRAAKGAEIASSIARREAEAQKPETQKRLESAKRALADAKFQGDKARIAMWRDHVADLSEKLESEQAAERKAEAFAKDRRIALIREEADLIARSGQALLPNSSQVDRDTLVAIARSESYPDPDSQFRDFKELSDRLTDVEIEAERVKASDAAIEAARQGLTAAESKVRTAELEQARARREGVANA
jgi:hypothetical protein